MIVPMKKVSLVIVDETRQASLKALRRAGVLHIERAPDQGGAPDELVAEAALLEEALRALPNGKPTEPRGEGSREEAHREAEAILELRRQEEDVHERLRRYEADRERLEPWGDFEPADLRILDTKGISVRLVNADAETQAALAEDDRCEFMTLKKVKAGVQGAAIYRGELPEDAVEGIELPESGITELEDLMHQCEVELEQIRGKLDEKRGVSGLLNTVLQGVRQDIEFEEVRSSLGSDETLSWFEGYIPAADVDALKALASEESWGLMIRDPGPEDQVPSLVCNPAAIRMIQPVFRLMGIFPGYREADISLWFLTFLSIFTAMILGDAAYGLIILLLVTFVRIRSGKSSDTIRLLTLFGVTTFIWGALTGTWFSSLAIVRDTPLRRLVIPAIATYQQDLFPGYTARMAVFPGDTLDADAMVKWISLFFGIVMISIARIQSFIMKLPSLKALAQLGWLSIVLALYWLIMKLVLQLSPLPVIMDLVLPMILGGLGLVLIFGGQEKGQGFGKGVLNGFKDLLPTALDSIGAFGDIISFIRLFAVGLAGVALSQSFNGMAPTGGGLAVVAAVLILALGHTLNIVLNALSVLVHGVRLNVLEFSGHLDMEWAGIGFEPFRLRVPESETPETDKE